MLDQQLEAYPRDMSVPEVFTWNARRDPTVVALVAGSRSVTYGELDLISNAFARRLTRLGVAHGAVVGTLTHRSIKSVIAWIAILKCGAIYMPIDPACPPGMIAELVADIQPRVILANRCLIAEKATTGLAFMAIEGELAQARGEVGDLPQLTVGPLDAAYIMFTSGSTGRPKGVVVPHRAIVRLVRDQSYASISSSEVFLSLAPLGFDACTFEIWGALLNGARLAIVEEPAPSLDDIAAAIRQYGVTTLWLTAGLFHAIVDCRLDALKPLRQLLAGGDVLSPSHVRKALEALPGCRLINGYGPTENTTFSCCHKISIADCAGSIPIGRPIAHTIAYILDDAMRPVADGEKGQLCLGGDGLALGYHNRSELTGERFITVQFGAEPGERLYLTGDQACRRPTGEIDFFGRTDRQVKIDGKRIELDEIELVLRRDPELADAVVMLSAIGEVRKIAAVLKPVQPDPDGTVAGRVLSRLREQLPAHMVPRGIAVMDEFPLTANGKVDRAALLVIIERRVGDADAPPPTSALEHRIARIWGRALGIEHVPTATNFFELGGTSLIMMRIHAELRTSFAPAVVITDLFDHPTVADLARFLELPVPQDKAAGTAAARAALQKQALRQVFRPAHRPRT